MFSLTDMKLFVNGSHSIIQLMTQKKEKNLILDPFSSIVRLAILSYKREGCKISIYNNKITRTNILYNGPPPNLLLGKLSNT